MTVSPMHEQPKLPADRTDSRSDPNSVAWGSVPLWKAARSIGNAALLGIGSRSSDESLPVISVTTEALAIPCPGSTSAFLAIRPLATVGCDFGTPILSGPIRQASFPGDNLGRRRTTVRAQRRNQHGRIRLPRDVIKLADRLRLLLEPPVGTLLANERLRFARPPFGFQLDGIAFLYPRREAVLSDEMGLGKTMQAITAIRLLVRQGHLQRVLLVCPKPLVPNWQREFSLWAPELSVTIVDGPTARREWLWRTCTSSIIISNYESLVRDRGLVMERETVFDLVLLDEAQRIKNAAAATSDAVCSIERSRSWVLTGTPIENTLTDLVGIFKFVAPGQINAGMKPATVRRAIADHILRRTKEQVLIDLPPKLFRDAEVPLSGEQAESYRLAEEEGVLRLRAMRKTVKIQHVFELVLRLKQICNFDPATGASAKLERLEIDLEECAASGRKAIVFSQWVETIAELARRLARFRPAEFHGQLSQRARQAQIERFRDDPGCQLILMSYGAGSVGLNLQFANYVFLFDRWWNPAVEDQAINRAHRIGARDAVTVTRFLTLGTIEQRINDILEKKRALFDAIFEDSAAPGPGLTREEMFALFNLDCVAAA
jgi:SNF2 family DNA or RNA helicase